MSEQSSTVVMFRGLVMLICLVAIPLAALFGSSVPGLYKAICEKRWPTMADLKGEKPAAANTFSEPAKFVAAPPTSGGAPIGPLAVAADPRRQLAANNSPMLGSRWPGGSNAAAASGVIPAGYEAPAYGAQPPVPPQIANGNPAGAPLNPLPQGADNLLSLGSQGSQGESAGSANDLSAGSSKDPPGGTAASGTSSDPFMQVLDRLRSLGATYYLLESWGEQKQYRFFCRMSVGGNPQVTRPFWAIDSDPLRAMSQVLEQVQSWHSGRP